MCHRLYIVYDVRGGGYISKRCRGVPIAYDFGGEVRIVYDVPIVDDVGTGQAKTYVWKGPRLKTTPMGRANRGINTLSGHTKTCYMDAAMRTICNESCLHCRYDRCTYKRRLIRKAVAFLVNRIRLIVVVILNQKLNHNDMLVYWISRTFRLYLGSQRNAILRKSRNAYSK